MGSSARVALSAALAVPVAVALFFIMFKLIDRDYEQDDSKARKIADIVVPDKTCLLYTSPSPRDVEESRMPSSA